MIRLLVRDEEDLIYTDWRIEELESALLDPNYLVWVDVVDEAPETVEPFLVKVFHFHPLAIDDALNETHIPKLDDWQEYLYVVLRAAVLTDNDEQELAVPELDIFLGSNYLVTYAVEPISAVEKVWNLCQQDQRWLRRGPDYLLYRLSDEVVSAAVAAVERMHDSLDEIEDQIFGVAAPDTLEKLFTLKRNILKMQRIVVPQRDVLAKLSRNEYAIIDAEDRVFFRDVYDHLMQLNEFLDDMLILVGGALDTYLSVVNNRMNDIMKTLTVITAIFMPINFITGFFGMNFFQPSEPIEILTGRLAFIAVLVPMALIPLVMYWWMKRRAWL